MNKDEVIKFTKEKDYKLVKSLGKGAEGYTVLLFDPTIGQYFVCKKYDPLDSAYKETLYDRFIKEIRILYQINYPQIVRIFNYYLYPNQSTGFIIMEYIQGKGIKKYLVANPDNFNDIFEQTIGGFSYLESKGILHRDIRPSNIMVTDEGKVKIIDFGFGKEIRLGNEDIQKSISLNWIATPPSEFSKKIYDEKTEIYFVGNLFKNIMSESNIDSKYTDLINSMCISSYDKRINSFCIIYNKILEGEIDSIGFSETDKVTYQEFANALCSILGSLKDDCNYITDIEQITKSLNNVLSTCNLEEKLQNNVYLLQCFLNGGFKYIPTVSIEVPIIENFINWWKSISKRGKDVVLRNLWARLDNIKRFRTDDLPF